LLIPNVVRSRTAVSDQELPDKPLPRTTSPIPAQTRGDSARECPLGCDGRFVVLDDELYVSDVLFG